MIMKQMHVYTTIRKGISTIPVRCRKNGHTTQTEVEAATKPAGWDAAKPYDSIPGPKPVPLLGNMWRFLPGIGDLYGLDPLNLNKLFYEQYGKIARLCGISYPDIVMIYDPKDIEFLFRNEGVYPIRDTVSKSYGYYRKNIRHDVFQGIGGVAEVQGAAWHNIRSKLNPILLHPHAILQYVENVNTTANQLVQKMRYLANTRPHREMPEDFIKCIYAWTLESIMVICLDKHLGCLNVNLPKDSEPLRIIEAVLEIFQLFTKIENALTFRDIHKTKTWARFIVLMDFITFTFLKHLEETTNKLEKSKYQQTGNTTILQKLYKIDKKMILSTTMDFLIAGIDSTGKVAAAGLYYLAKTPNAQKTLRKELCNLLPDKDSPITKEVLLKAPYLRAVVNETTRLAPATNGTLRQTAKDMVIRGYQIPKGTAVITSNLTLSHSNENYITAKDFIPERWLRTTTGELSAKSAKPFVTLPFGFGPRSCLGKRLALLELQVGIAKVIRNFYLEWHNENATFIAETFYGIKDPLKLRVYEVEQ